MNLNVYRSSQFVGVLDMCEGDPFYGFTYADSYLGSSDAAPLSCSLPLSERRYSGFEALPYFEGLLPEGDVRYAVARQFHASPNSPSQLLRVLGRDCAGAVMVVEEDDPAQPPAKDEYLTLHNGLEDIARNPLQKVAELRAEFRLSLAGAQEKVALYHDERFALVAGWHVPVNGSPSSHIVKPQMSDRFPELAVNEFLCMRTASLLGIKAAEVSLLYPEHPLLLVCRFDRVPVGGENAHGLQVLVRMHQEDCCQALGHSSSEKYEGSKSSYLYEIFELLIRESVHPGADLQELFKLLMFNYVIGNCDAHLKNYSLLQVGKMGVRLAPAYDLVSTTVYDGDYGGKLSRSMGVRMGDHLNIDKVKKDDIQQLVRDLRQPARVVEEVLAQIRDGLDDAVRGAAEEAVDLGFHQAREFADRLLNDACKRRALLQM